MDSVHFSAGAPPTVGTHAVITRVDDLRWQAVEDDRVVGHGEASRRPDGRVFLSIDTWHGAVFDRLATAMLADLPSPLYTMVDEADHDLTARWERAGLTVRRREREYLVRHRPAGHRARHRACAVGRDDPGPRCGAGARAARGVRGGPRRGRRHAWAGTRCRSRCRPGRTGLPWTRRSTRWPRPPIGTWGWSGWWRAAGTRGSG